MKSVKVRYPWEDDYPIQNFPMQVRLMLSLTDANEAYREGFEPIISDSEFDYLLGQVKMPEFKELVGTEMKRDKTIELIHQYTYGTGWECKIPHPKDRPYNPHYVEALRVWDKEYKRMDENVLIQNGSVWMPAGAEEVDQHKAGTLNWTAEQTAVIAGTLYFGMPLDEYFVVMRKTPAFDMDGAEIWEGDLLKTPDDIVVEVVWDRAMLVWHVTQDTIEVCDSFNGRVLYDTCWVSKKVGNVYDNPGLKTPDKLLKVR